jgi:hypothetical protein
LVEHTTENRGVAGSIPALAIFRLQRIASPLRVCRSKCGLPAPAPERDERPFLGYTDWSFARLSASPRDRALDPLRAVVALERFAELEEWAAA